MLDIKGLHAYYGPIEALKGIDIQAAAGEITCLIGANGAGKTTLLKSISGMIHRTGEINFADAGSIISKRPRQIAHMGIIHVPEGRHIFPGLTVRDNLETGTINWHGFFGSKSYANELEEVSTSERTGKAAWLELVRRRAANAGHRPRADGASQNAHAGRAFHGSCPVGHCRAV